MPEDTSSTTTESTEGEPQGATQQPPAQEQPPAKDDGELGDAGKKALDAMKAERNAATSENKALKKELDKVKQAAMSESDRAVAEAEARGRSAAIGEVGQKLARAQFDALAGRRNPDVDTSSVLEFVDLSRFVGEDGEPDAKALASAVERLVPAPQQGPPSFDGGARRTASQTTDMNALIRSHLGGPRT